MGIEEDVGKEAVKIIVTGGGIGTVSGFAAYLMFPSSAHLGKCASKYPVHDYTLGGIKVSTPAVVDCQRWDFWFLHATNQIEAAKVYGVAFAVVAALLCAAVISWKYLNKTNGQ